MAATIRLFQEVESLASYIQQAKAEITALRPQDIQTQYIASATDELDAILAATESATNQILDVAETLEDLIGKLPPEQAEPFGQITTRVYEACNFQDITGQRITKIVKALQNIEERVNGLMKAFGAELKDQIQQTEAPPSAPVGSSSPTDADLLNGPQLPSKAADQATVDALFKD